MGKPWGSFSERENNKVTYYWIMKDSGDRYGPGTFDNTDIVSSNARYNHTNNPPNPRGVRGPSSYLTEEYHYETKAGSWVVDGYDRTTFISGKISNYQQDHVGSAGPCMDGLSLQADTNLRARVKTECLVKLGDVKTQVLQNIATSVQTANLLADTVDELAKALLAIKRRNFRGSSNALVDAGGNLLLIYKYGWEPLVGDIKGAVDLLMEQNLEPVVSAKRNLSDSRSLSTSGSGYRWNSKYEVFCRCKLFAKVDKTWAHGAHRWGADISNVPWMLWDLVPWSFVVDWVMPVGNLLEALTATAGLNFENGYISDHVSAEADITVEPWNSDVRVQSDFGGRFKGKWYRREALSGFPLPEPYVKSPFTPWHALESLALLRQMR